MDTGKGHFVKLNAETLAELEKELTKLKRIYPGHGGIFREGEIVELRGSHFEISKIISNGLKLKLLKKQ